MTYKILRELDFIKVEININSRIFYYYIAILDAY